MNFPIEKKGTIEDQSASKASFQVDFLLVDDQMNFITREPLNKWSKQVTAIPNGVKNFRNTKITPQRDYYFLLDGKVVTIIYNTIVIIDPNAKGEDCNVSIKQYQLDPSKWVMSWSFDTNENLFYKYKDDSKIYKVKASELKNNLTNVVSPTTYFSLADTNIPDIKDNANNFVLYNVYGYQGQIMLINSWYDNSVNVREYNSSTASKKYGLAVAIVENSNNEEVGDIKGILNGEDSFQNSADFYVNENVLKTKLPSEITKNDLTITNDGFLTQNKTIENNELKYKPFEISDIDDKKGTFTITTNIDQIPWFSNTLPKDSIPTKIIKKYNNSSQNDVAQKIETKVSWKSLTKNDYDFINTLPSKIEENDLIKFDPFQVSFNSQTILNNKGEQIYPKKTYNIELTNDDTGEIVISVLYEYVPLGWTYENSSDVLKHVESKTYSIYSKAKKPIFYFSGANANASENSNAPININNVPELKFLTQSNLLPSSFLDADKSMLYQFVNINKSEGYPISKMNFEVEANDELGTLTITAILRDGYYENKPNIPTKFKQVFTGLNSKLSYKFSFNENVHEISGQKISSILPSAINEGDIIKHFITYSGFNSNDFTINLFPNNVDGKLYVEILLNQNYSETLANSNSFNNYKTVYEFSGFMTQENYNNQYTINFKNNDDLSLLSIKKLTPSEIYNSLVSKNDEPAKGLEINGTRYENLNDLVQKIFIKYFGSKIINTNWKNNQNIKTKMTYDNNAGSLNILLTIKKDAIEGLSSDLNIVASYDGFAKGNIIDTGDNLAFIDNDLLKTLLVQNEYHFNVNEFKKWLESSQENLNFIISHVSGIYEELIRLQKYELKIVTNDVYNTIYIDLKFNRDDVPEQSSLLNYSIQYLL